MIIIIIIIQFIYIIIIIIIIKDYSIRLFVRLNLKIYSLSIQAFLNFIWFNCINTKFIIHM
jgi:hypothetical protein